MPRKILVSIALIACDFLILLSCFLIAYLLRTEVFPLAYAPLQQRSVSLTWYFSNFYLFSIWFLVFLYEKLYTKRFPFWEETRVLLKSTTMSFALIMIMIFVTQQYQRFSRLVIVIAWLLSLVMYPVFRYLCKALLLRLNLWKKRVIIIGTSNALPGLIEAIRKNRSMGYEIAGLLISDKEGASRFKDKAVVLGHLDDLERIKKEVAFDDIIVRLPDLPAEKVIALMKEWERLCETIRYIPRTGDLVTAGIEIENIGRLLSLTVRRNLAKPWNIFIKNVVEFVLSLLALLILTPLFLILSIIIKLESPGPVFFVQERFGKYGRNITLIKFRSMHVDAEARLDRHFQQHPDAKEEWAKYRKMKTSDPRVTWIGKFMRKHSFDELPQLVNVLKGEMSLVGPRPYLEEELREVEGMKSILLQVKPGITGLWQVSGRSSLLFEERLALDEYYLRNWSLWQDIVILIKTVRASVSGSDAY